MLKRKTMILLSILIMLFTIGCNKESEGNENNEDNNVQDQAVPPLDNETKDDEENEGDQTEDEEAEDLSSMKEADQIVLLNDIDSTAIDDYAEEKWRKLSQENGIERRIYYGDQKLLQSETGSPGAGTYLFDLDENGPIWQHDRLSYSGFSHLLLEDGVLYVTDFDEIIGLDYETGDTLKQYQLPESSTFREIYLFEEYLLVGYGEDLFLFDKETEELLWDIPFHTIRNESNSTHNVYLVNDVFITSYHGEKLVGIDVKTGEELWSIETPNANIDSFLVDEDVIYLFNGYHQLEGGKWASNIEMYDVSSQEKMDEVIFVDGDFPRGAGSFSTGDQMVFIQGGDSYQSIISADHDLTEENWVVKGEDHYIQDMIYDNGKIYVLAEDDENDDYLFIIIDASSGEVEEKIILEEGKNNDPNTFYVHDQKVYVQIKAGSDFYYIFDQEDVHRPFP